MICRDDVIKRHDAFIRKIWVNIPLVLRIIISPFVLPIYIAYILIAYFGFVIPYSILDWRINVSSEEVPVKHDEQKPV
jgi:hypothetical protein